MLEAVIGLPDQLFYNTGIYTYIWIVTNNKKPSRKGKVQLINGTEFAWRMKKSFGDKRKEIGNGEDNKPDHISELTRIYNDFLVDDKRKLSEIKTNIDPEREQDKEIFVSKIFNNSDFGYIKMTVERPLRLNFIINEERLTRLKNTAYFTGLSISKKRKDKSKIAEEIKVGEKAQQDILDVLNSVAAETEGKLFKERKELSKFVKEIATIPNVENTITHVVLNTAKEDFRLS
jgi:type I restriction enzyme M protein